MTKPKYLLLKYFSSPINNIIFGDKGTFHAKMGTIKHRNGMHLTKAEDIKKRWQEYTEELYKNLHDPMITHSENNGNSG